PAVTVICWFTGDTQRRVKASEHHPFFPKGDTTMGLIGLIISWIIIGGIIGLIARALMPGKQAMGLGLTIVLGVIGAVVGGFIGGLFGGDGVSGIMNNPWSLWTILLSVIGALIVMFIYGLATKNRA